MSDTTERRREFGAYLAGLRRHSGRSQRQFATVLCAVSGAQSITRNEVSRWERGERIPDVWLPTYAQALGVPLRELEQAAAYARGDAQATLPGVAAALADLLARRGRAGAPGCPSWPSNRRHHRGWSGGSRPRPPARGRCAVRR